MRKILALFLVFILFITSVPLETDASENSAAKFNELISRACDAFPEYATDLQISCAANTYSRTLSEDTVIHEETRQISETESITLIELASGNFIVVENNTDYIEISYDTSNTNNITNVGVTGTVSIEVAMSFVPNEYFRLSNVDFTIYNSGSDYFTDTGTVSKSSGVYTSGTTQITSTYIRYPLMFVRAPFAADFRIYFSDNQLVIDVSI